MESLRRAPLPDQPDLAVAIALTQLLHKDLTAYGTDGQDVWLEDDTVVYAIKTHRSVLSRLGLEAPEWPFKSLTGFHDYWRRNGMSGGGGLAGPTRVRGEPAGPDP